MVRFSLFFILLLIGCNKGGDGDGGTGGERGHQSRTHKKQIIWDGITTNTDGTVISDLGGYKVYVGITPGTYSKITDIGNTVEYEFIDVKGTYYIVVTAYDVYGNESDYSNEITVKLP